MRQKSTPLPIKNGLNPTRVRVEGVGASGISAQDFLFTVIFAQRHRHPDDNAAAIAQRFEDGEVVRHNGTPLSAGDILTNNTEVYFYKTPAPETPVPYSLDIVYRDEDLIVVDKPPFMATMPRARHIVETATVKLRRMTGIDQACPAHRLDRLTSGVVVFTTRRELRGSYQRLFAERKVHKTYEAIAADAPQLRAQLADDGIQWSSRLDKTPGQLQARVVDGTPNAHTTVVSIDPVSPEEQAVLERVHGPLPLQARYVLSPQTGKTHQLRVHMLQAGVPILGDPIYPRIHREDEENFAIPMHLLAREISFTDPIDGSPRSFRTEHDVLARLRY